MMYYSSSGSLHGSQLESLLSQEDVSLDEILSEPNVVDECKAENNGLLTFITQSHCLRQLVELSISGPDQSAPLCDQFRRCHVATELLSSGVPRVSFALLHDSESLDVLYDYLHVGRLTHLSASFVYRIFSSLIQHSSQEVYNYFTQKSDLPLCILANIDKPAILDLFYNFIQSHSSSEISVQLSDSTLISDLISLLSLDQTEEIHSSVIQCLCSLLTSSRMTNRPVSDLCLSSRNGLLEKLESFETIQSIWSRVFDQTSGQVISDSILINTLLYSRCLIDPGTRIDACPDLAPLPRNDNFYLWSDRVGISLCETLLPNLSALKERLLISGKIAPLPLPPSRPMSLTPARLHIARFLLYLITARSKPLIHEILTLDFVNILLDLFFQFPINTFLHSTCECLIRQIVLRALLNICVVGSYGPSPSNSVTFSSTDIFHKQFFTPSSPEPAPSHSEDSTTESSEACESSTPVNGSGDDQTSAEPQQPEQQKQPEVNVFWLFLSRLLVDGNLLSRIVESWHTNQTSSNRGHMRLIANLLTAVIGPCPEAYEDDALGSADQLHLITPDHLVTVASNGCTNECDTNPALRSFLRSKLSDQTWTAWCEFVRGPLSQANEKSYVNYTEFPNSMASSEQNVTEYKLTDYAISQALQNAYSNYCSQPLTSVFMDQFGYAEDEFTETQSHPNLVLDARLSEVSFSLHIHEDTENGSLFEQVCNDVIQLNGKEVGLDGLCLPEPAAEPSASKTDTDLVIVSPNRTTDTNVSPLIEKSASCLPSRTKLLEVFDEIQSGMNGVLMEDEEDEDDDDLESYANDETQSDDDLDAVVLVDSSRLAVGHSQDTTGGDGDVAVETHLLLNGFDHQLRLKNLPTLAETEPDGEEDDLDEVDNEWDQSEPVVHENGRSPFSPKRTARKPINGVTARQTNHVPPNSRKNGFITSSPLGGRSLRDRRPTPPVPQSPLQCLPSIRSYRSVEIPTIDETEIGDEDEDADREITKRLSAARLDLDIDVRAKENGVRMINDLANGGLAPALDRARIDGAHTFDYDTLHPGTNGNGPYHSPPAVPLSAWKTHMVLTQQSDSLGPSSINCRTPRLPDTSSSSSILLRGSENDQFDDRDNIEMGDLSAGLSHLTRSSTKTGVLQSKQLNWTADRLVDATAPRSLIMPTKRASNAGARHHHHHEGYANPLCSPAALADRLHPQIASRVSQSTSPDPVSTTTTTNGTGVADTDSSVRHTEYSLMSSHFASKSSHTSCGITATVKVRHGSKAHSLPPFVISENDLGPGDLGTDDCISSNRTPYPIDGVNGFETLDLLDTDLGECEPSADPNSSKARYRSHRTIQLRPGSEDQVADFSNS